MTFYENDEDLFNYDPESELTTTNAVSNEQDSTEAFLSPAHLDFFKAKTAVSFLNAQGIWYDAPSVQTSSANKAAHVILDQITDGRFSLLKYFYEVELNIARKRSIIYITSRFINAITSSGNDKLKIKITNLDFEVDFTVVMLFMNNNLNLMNHAMSNLVVLYSELAKKLDLECNQDLLSDISFSEDESLNYFDGDNDEMVTMFSQMFSKSHPCDYLNYLNNVYHHIYQSLSQQGLLDSVKSKNTFVGDIEIC